LSVAARAATLGVVVIYVNAQINGEPIVLLDQTLPSEASLASLAFWGGSALLFALLDVGARVWSDRMIFGVGQSYANSAMQVLLRHAAVGGVFESIDEIMRRQSNPIVPILSVDSQRLIRVVVQLLSLPLPVTTFVVFLAWLAQINLLLTAILVPLVLAYSVGVTGVNRKILRDTQRRRLAMPSARQDLNGLAFTLSQTRYPRTALPAWLTTFPRNAWMERGMRAYRGIWFARRRVQYLRDGFNGMALLLIVMVFGMLLASENTPWATLLTYFVALGYAIQSMDKASGLITAANRQIPHIRRYVWFMQHQHGTTAKYHAKAAASPPGTGAHTIRVDGESLPGSSKATDLAPGNPSYCLHTEKFDNTAVGALALALAGGDEQRAAEIEAQTFAFAGFARLPERSLRQHLPEGTSSSEALDRVREVFEQLGLLQHFEKQIGSVNRHITTEEEKQLAPGLRYALRVLPGLLGGQRYVMLAERPFADLDADLKRRILALLEDQIIVFVPEDPSLPLPEDADCVFAVSDARVCGIGDRAWHEDLRSQGVVQTPAWLIAGDEAAQAPGTDDLDLDDDDDDE
ncbi:MAG: ABC transporter ATP-binding protein, partial [bacterium]|nr:ABC transporter ATP-binding protein [bacterium]